MSSQTFQHGAKSATGKDPKNDSAKFAKFGAAASFAPAFTLNVNAGNKTNTGGSAPMQRGGGRGGAHPDGLLPAPEFTSPAQVRNYCNSLRAAAVSLSFEVSMGAEILKGVLSTVADPNGRIGGSKIRAMKVSRKLRKSADALRDAAKNAAATYAAFQAEYEEEINRVRHRARRPQGPRMDWAQQ